MKGAAQTMSAGFARSRAVPSSRLQGGRAGRQRQAQRLVSDTIVASRLQLGASDQDGPIDSHGGGMMWHLRLPLRLTAIQSGTSTRFGGRNGP